MAVTSERSARRPPRPSRGGDWSGLCFVAPFFVAYTLFLIVPLLLGLKMSLSHASLAGGNTEFAGLDNFLRAVTDPAVWTSLWHTALFTLLSTPLLVVTGLVLALLAHNLAPARWLWRLSFFAPFLLPSSVVALIFVWIFQPGFGLADGLLAMIGLDVRVGWLASPSKAMLSIVFVTVWWTAGFNFLLYLAALQAIPAPLYEAAALDGASWWQQLWRITLPMLKRTTGLVIVLQLLASLKVFDQIYLITGGGPGHSTRPVIQYIYETGFTNFQIGYASAISYIFFALILLVALAQVRLSRTREEATS